MKLIKMKSILFLLLSIVANQSNAQDTIRITEKEINTKALREGTHRYLVYFKMKKDAPRTQTQFWTRTIERTTQNEKPLILNNCNPGVGRQRQRNACCKIYLRC